MLPITPTLVANVIVTTAKVTETGLSLSTPQDTSVALVAQWLCDNALILAASPQQGGLRLLGPPSGHGAGVGARTRDRMVPADLRADWYA
ncbi:hypothetical protein PoB_002552700 [Plakobranchus ocellatus]|uniref:Uncharacterized protein n=1 Tax=Plakobranchus ocellatus TaxID=259542 RepID=A0AAV3ZWT3_9GAST|nr:hypothetical protein PoB_002552700 [Plakobranchus ocellatus]